jgi:membrane protein
MAQHDPRKGADRPDDRGRSADRPGEIPKRGWKDILKRTKEDVRHDHVTVVAAGVAFFVLLALVPGIAALISIYGFMADPQQVQQQFDSIRNVIPAEVHQLLSDQMQRISRSSTAAGFGAAVSLLLALWGGSKGVKALMDGLNIMYEEEEKRSFIKLNLTALALTIAGIAGLAIMIGLAGALPALLERLPVSETARTWMLLLRWPLIIVFFVLALGVLYRFGPSRDHPKWKWVSWGATVATVLWLTVSVLFSVYVANFGSYNKTYGALGAIVVLLMWLYISAYAVLVGAELNAQMELQTARDTTKGAPEPRGGRGAFAADNVG